MEVFKIKAELKKEVIEGIFIDAWVNNLPSKVLQNKYNVSKGTITRTIFQKSNKKITNQLVEIHGIVIDIEKRQETRLSASLSRENVKEIYNECMSCEKKTEKFFKEVGRKYEVSSTTIRNIAYGRQYSNITDSKKTPFKKRKNEYSSLEGEVWKTVCGVPSFDETYEVSNFGRVRNKNTKRILCGNKNTKEYRQVCFKKNDIQKTLKVHRLVALAFVENKNNLPQVNHIDGNKMNNNVSNLEWCSGEYNIKHKMENGLNVSHKGEDHGNSKLKENDVVEIFNSKCKSKYLSEKYGVSVSTIQSIKSGRNWGWLTSDVENNIGVNTTIKSRNELILDDWDSGLMTKKKIADKYNIQQATVARLVKIIRGGE